MILIKMSWFEGADQVLGLPTYASAGAAGADLRANFSKTERDGLVLAASERALVPTGLRLEIPLGYEVQIRPRSGLAFRNGITLANSPGTIDNDYRGQLMVILLNTGGVKFQIHHGDRIAQMVVAPVVQARFELAEGLSETVRGVGGFGSTGQG